MTTETNVLPGQDILGFLPSTGIPEIQWVHGDDLCDCIFQRIGWWTNPYLARTLEVRMCCIWAELYKQYPQFVREIPAYDNPNTGEYEVKPTEWNSVDSDMPRALWHRQLAIQMNLPLSRVRDLFGSEEPPGRVTK